MAQEKNSKNKKQDPDSSSGELPKQTAKKKKTPFLSLPPLPLPGKTIHPRQVIPPVTKGKDVPDDTPTPPVDPD